MRRNRNKRRGVQHGVQKHKIRSKGDKIFGQDPQDRRILGIKVAEISRSAQVCFTLLCRISCSTYALPMEFYFGKLSLTTSWKHLLLHYTLLAAAWTTFGLKVVICTSLLFEEGLMAHTLMSLVSLVPCMCAGTLGIGNIFKVRETVQLVNSWKVILDCLEEPKGRPVSGYEDLKLSLKIIAVAFTAVLGIMGMIVTVFIFPDLPVASHNIFLRFGIGCSINKRVLQVLCVPLELLLLMQPTICAAFGAAVLVIGIDVLKVYYEQLR